MAPVLTEPDKDPESPRTPVEHGAAPPRHTCRLGRRLHALLKSNLKNLLADCGAQLHVCAAGGLHDFSPPDVGAMKNVLGEHCKPTNGIMDSEEPEKEDVMGLHSANSSNLQELLNNKKQFAGSLVASSPPPDLADMIHEFETLAESAPLTSGNGHVPPEEMQMITQLVTSMDENPPVAAAVVAPPQQLPVVAVPPPPPAAPSPLTVEATQVRQTQLVGRSTRLLRRLRALQARAARRQTTAQTSTLLERLSAAHAAPSTAATSTAPAAGAATATSSLPSPAVASAGTATTTASGDITEMLRSPNAKHFSTTQLVNLILNNKSATAAAAATAAPPPSLPAPESTSSSARAEREVAAAVARPAGVARRQVDRLLSVADSDATESSSGGESGDEFEPGWDDEALERAAPIRKRALWRWATDRSALAYRWSWLAAQVTDLEFRVRQLRQLHRQLRATNSRPPPGRAAVRPAPTAARELGGAGDASSALRVQDKASESADAEEGDGQCARTRHRPATARRRVFSVARAARRTAGGAPARCRCDPGVDACTTCAGRLDSGVRVRPEAQPVRERRALLAAGHHPVLSLPAEAALSLGYDALLRSPRWQQNHLHARPRGPRLVTKELSGPAAAAAAAAAPGANGGGGGGGCTPAGMPSTPPVPITPCSRPSFHRRKSGVLKRLCDLDGGSGELTLGGGRVGRPPKLCRRSRSASVCDARPAAGTGPVSLAGDDESAWTAGRQSPERRESRERPSAAHRRHRQNSYDIDNIVIPASMASTTKIEKPKYKEIVTPGWRPVEVQSPSAAAAANGDPAPPPPPSSSRSPSVSPEPLESLDDAAFERRHLPAEREERRRLYQSAGKPPGGTAAAGGGGGAGHGRGRRAHTPDTPRATDADVDAGRPRILRYMYSLEPCGFPGRQFPLSDQAWKELLTSAESEDSCAQHGWRSPRSRSSAGSGSTEPALASEEQRSTK